MSESRPLGYTAPRDRPMLTAMRHKALLVLGLVLLAVAMGACGGGDPSMQR